MDIQDKISENNEAIIRLKKMAQLKANKYFMLG